MRTNPEANASLPEAPDRLELEFSEAVSVENAFIEVLAGSGAVVEGLTDADVVAVDGDTVTATLPDLPDGVYTVRFRVVSALDGHATEGTFAFQIDPSGTQPPLVGTTASTTTSGDLATTVAKWLGLAGALALFGIALFWLVAGRPALDLVESRRERRGVWRAMAGASLVALAGLALFLTLSSRGLVTVQPGSGHSHFALDFAGPFGTTLFANAMRVVEVATFLAFFLALTRAVASERPRVLEAGITAATTRIPATGRSIATVHAERRGETLVLVLMLVLGAAALAGYSLAGHVSAGGGPLGALNDWGHLLAVATWIGTLPGLLVFFGVYAARQPADLRKVALKGMLKRHSAVALVAAPVVALTGIANSPVVVGSSQNLVATDYGNIVVAKILLFSLAAAIGSANFFLLRRDATRSMGRTVVAELAIGVVAVFAAAALGTTAPAGARTERLVMPPVEPAVLTESVGDLDVQLVVTPPVPGRQLYQASVLDAEDGAYRSDVAKVFLLFSPPAGSDLAPQRIEADASPTQPGLFRVSGTYTPIVGDWTVEVVIRRAGVADASVSLELPVRAPSEPESVAPPPSGIGVPAPLRAAWALLPPAPFEWVPAAALFALGGVLFVVPIVAARRFGGGLRTFVERARLTIVAVAVAAALLAGSRILVSVLNAPPAEAASAANPEPATSVSVERGARAFAATCESCHAGADPLDSGSHSDGELYHWITNGIPGTNMPSFATELSPRDRWDIVNYLRVR